MVENLPGEEWRDIKSYEGLYQVSNMGRVKGLAKVWSNNINPRPARILKPSKVKAGKQIYFYVKLSLNGIKASHKVHRLVAQAFIPNPENKPQVNHIDSEPTNNNDWNLEWCTSKENAQHAAKKGRLNKRKKTKLSRLDIDYIKFLHKKIPNKDIGKMFGIVDLYVIGIAKGRYLNNVV